MKKIKKFRKKTDYEKVSSAPARDVYRNQQLDRSKLSSTPKKTYQMVALASFVILLVVFYVLVTAITFGISRTKYQMDISTAKLSKEYVGKTDGGNLGINTKYFVADEEGNPMTDARYDSEMDVPEPDWHKEKIENAKANAPTLASTFKQPLSSQWKQIAAVLFMSLAIESLIYTVLMRKWEAQTAESRTDDINQYDNDQHITLPEELFEDYDVFPDAGAHSGVSVSTLISHAAMENKGVNQTKIAKRYKEDVLDENGEVLHFEGELIRDDNDEIVEEKVPMFDKKFGEALFKTSGAEEMYWKCWNPSKIASNPKGKNREKFGKFDTISDLINNDWVLPFYEPQRPSGVYLVDGSPVNTMVLAITRVFCPV